MVLLEEAVVVQAPATLEPTLVGMRLRGKVIKEETKPPSAGVVAVVVVRGLLEEILQQMSREQVEPVYHITYQEPRLITREEEEEGAILEVEQPLTVASEEEGMAQ
jgi:hypothetical protein